MRLLLVLLLVVIGLQTRAQVDWCDSVSYTVYPNPNLVFSVLGEVSDSLSSHVDTVDFTWEVCNSSLCFNDFGQYASFPLIQQTDTVKVCYNAYLIQNWQTILLCQFCDTVVHNGKQWVLLGSGGTVGVTEIPLRPINKIYNLQGIELLQAPKNKMYIKNRKIYYELCD